MKCFILKNPNITAKGTKINARLIDAICFMAASLNFNYAVS